MNSLRNYHEFVDCELKKKKLNIILITQQIIIERLTDITSFVNSVRMEFAIQYGWGGEKDEYFLNPMDRKFCYSFMITNKKDEIINMNFSSVYMDRLHLHCMYTRNDSRKLGLSKLTMLKLCQKGIDNGFKTIGGFWPKTNNGSLILFLKLGLEIECLRNNVDLFLSGNLEKIINNSMKLYCKENS